MMALVGTPWRHHGTPQEIVFGQEKVKRQIHPERHQAAWCSNPSKEKG
jgi:hypothetical protein